MHKLEEISRKDKKHEILSSSSSVSLSNVIEDNDDNEINFSGTCNGRRKIVVKTNFNNLLKSHQRNTLKRQDEGVEEDEEAEEQISNSNFNKSTENLISNDEVGKGLITLENSSNSILSQSALVVPHLTNILEDEEEILSQQLTTSTKPISNQTLNLKSVTSDLNNGITQFNSNISVSRRSSRGGNSSDNALSSLTIPEEAETDTNFVSLGKTYHIKNKNIDGIEYLENSLPNYEKTSNYFFSIHAD